MFYKSKGKIKKSKHATIIFNFYFLFLIYYSVLKLFTGFAIAALIAWKLTVNNAINITNNPADANSHQLNVIRYGKFCNHLFAAIYASGDAIIKAITTSFIKSVERVVTILFTDAPSTFRMPISFVLFSADKTDNPNKPMHEINMVSIALNKIICFHFSTSAYCFLFSSFLNTYE